MPIRQQSAHPYDNHLDVCGVAVVSRRWQGESGGGRVQAIHHHSSYNFEILHGIVLYIFHFKINTLLCYTVVSVLVLVSLEANIIGYWILGALFGIVLTLFIFGKILYRSY